MFQIVRILSKIFTFKFFQTWNNFLKIWHYNIISIKPLPSFTTKSRARMTKSRACMKLWNYMLFHFDWNLTYQVLLLYILRSHHLTWETSLEDAHTLVQKRHLYLQAFCKIILDVRIGAQQGICQGRRGFLEYGHFDERFMYDMEKNCPEAGNCDHESLLQVEIRSSPAM